MKTFSLRTLFAVLTLVAVGIVAYTTGATLTEGRWRDTLKLKSESLAELSKWYLIPPPPDSGEFGGGRTPGWVAKAPTGSVVKHELADAERAHPDAPGGFCNRCQRPWGHGSFGVKPHTTPLGVGNGCFPLCEKCWFGLTPEQRLPYYDDLHHEWSEYQAGLIPIEVFRAAVLHENGKGDAAAEDLPIEVVSAWENAGGMPKRPSI